MKIRIKQTWGFLILSILVIIYLSIFSFKFLEEEEDVTEIYFAERITAAHKILIDRYNELNKGKVKVIPIDFPNFDFATNERKEILARSLRSRGDGIDLFAVDIIWTQRFAKWSEPLDKYFTVEDRKRILDVALKPSYYDGQLVSIPQNLVQGVMYYREDLLKQKLTQYDIDRIEKGLTWEEFIELSERINSEQPYYVFPAADYEGLICSFNELVLSLKPNYFEDHGFNFNTPEAERSLQLLVDLINKYQVTPVAVTNFTEIPSYEYFLNENALFIRGWPSYDKDFKGSDLDRLTEEQIDKAPIPHFKDGKPTSTLGGWHLMISKFSNKKDEAADFLKFLLSDESQEVFYQESSYYPVIKKFYNDDSYVERYPEMVEFQELIKTAAPRPSHVEYTRYSEIMSHYFELAIQNRIGVQEALTNATNSIQVERLIVNDIVE